MMRIYNQQQLSDSLKKIKAWIHLFQLGTIGGNPLPTEQKSQKGDCFRIYISIFATQTSNRCCRPRAKQYAFNWFSKTSAVAANGTDCALYCAL
jgi:hypothetical protein